MPDAPTAISPAPGSPGAKIEPAQSPAPSRHAKTFGLLLVLTCLTVSPSHGTQPSYEELLPLLQNYCYDCHDRATQKAELDLERFAAEKAVLEERRTWKKVWHMLHIREMPPVDEQQPSPEERAALTDWIELALAKPDESGVPNPGHVPPRRLTAAQYNFTVHDLLRVHRRSTFYDPERHGGMPEKVRFVLHRQFQVPLVELPPDPVAHGFDSMAEAMSIPPYLLEKYLDAAKKLTDREDVRGAFGRRTGLARGIQDEAQQDRILIADYVRRAFRRPPSEDELKRYSGFYSLALENGASRDEAVGVALQAILVAPQFLFRMESGVAEEDEGGVRPLTDYELSARLSFFLWNTMPDEQLFALADAGELRDPVALEAQVLRMLRNPKAEEFVKDFAFQWLRIQDIKSHAPDPSVLPAGGRPLRYLNESMMTELMLLFGTIVAEDRSILELIDADYTWMNQTLCDLYGIAPQETGQADQYHWLRYPLTDRRRGGIVTAGATLMVNSNSTHTNPVKRGKWLLEAVLGQPPPPPLPDVPNLDATPVAEGGLPSRNKLELHRSDPACASCHRRLDPLGLALENYDAIGAWRDTEDSATIDPSGSFPDGVTFDGPAGLKDALLTSKREHFLRCLIEHLMSYALGRPVDYYDIATIQMIGRTTAANDFRFSTLITEIVKSYPFRYLKTRPEDS